ncbi:hypothetical protein OFD71_43850, partial [Escherichia coli]|nr:hypothetical protein [Escherichia coli]
QRKAEAKEEVKTTLESLCEKHGLSLKEALDAIEGVDEVRDSDVIAKDEQEDEEQEQKEEEPEEDAEEKSDSLDDFFT